LNTQPGLSKPATETGTLSKQLAISIAFSVMTMSAFALSMSPPHAPAGQGSSHKNGAIAEAAAPSFFSVLLR
jgi:hypothetical protein